MVVWVVIFLAVVYLIGRACARFLDCDAGGPETMADYAQRFREAERLHKERAERVQKQMDETRKHMEEW